MTVTASRSRYRSLGYLASVASLLLVSAEAGFAQSGTEKRDWSTQNPGLPNTTYEYRQDWRGYSGGEQNISVYVFRDRDRDGIYGINDRPLAAVFVEMTTPRGDRVTRRSNVNGFTNFKMSLRDHEADIRYPGLYRFRVITPKGWEVTSGNAAQSTEFSVFEGTIGDIVARRPFDPIGLSPQLSITGRVATRTEAGSLQPASDATLKAHSPDGREIDVEVSNRGRFWLPSEPGVWRLVATLPDGASMERTTTVGEVPVVLSTMVVGDPERPPQPVTGTVDFESISGAPLAEMPSGEAGVYWHNMIATDFLLYNGEGYMNSSMSGKYVAYNSSGHPVKIWRDDVLDFVGTYVGVAWRVAHGETLHFRARRDGKIVAQDSVRLSALGPVWFDADYRGVQQVEMWTEHYWQFVADDLVVRTPSLDLTP